MKSTVFGICVVLSIALSFYASFTAARIPDPAMVRIFNKPDRSAAIKGISAEQKATCESSTISQVLLYNDNKTYRADEKKDQVILNVRTGLNGTVTLLGFGKTVLDVEEMKTNEKNAAEGDSPPSTLLNFKHVFVVIGRELTLVEEMAEINKTITEELSQYYDADLPTRQTKLSGKISPRAQILATVQNALILYQSKKVSAEPNSKLFVQALAILEEIMNQAGGRMHILQLDGSHEEKTAEEIGKELQRKGLIFDRVKYMLEGINGSGNDLDHILAKAYKSLELSGYFKDKGIHYLANDISAFKGVKKDANKVVQADATVSAYGLYTEQTDAQYLVASDYSDAHVKSMPARLNPNELKEKSYIVGYVDSRNVSDFTGALKDLSTLKDTYKRLTTEVGTVNF